MGIDVPKPVLGVFNKMRLKSVSSKVLIYYFQKANKKGAEQSAPMHRLVCTIVV